MKTMSPAGLQIAPHPSLLELFMESQRGLPEIFERRCLAGIQIKNGLVGLSEVWEMRTPQVEFDGPLVGEPDQARYIVDQRQMNHVRGRLRLILGFPDPIGSPGRAIP